MIVTSEDSPIKRTHDIQDSPLRGALADHNWYPAVRRCACGLNLRSATHWVSHICQVAAISPTAAGLSAASGDR